MAEHYLTDSVTARRQAGQISSLPFSYKMYNRGHFCFLIFVESFEVLADSVISFPLDTSKQIDGQTSKDRMMKRSISLTIALKNQIASFKI